MSATGRGAERQEEDFYETPAWCVHRLLERVSLPGGCWLEPCAGAGAIIKAARAVRPDVRWRAIELREEMRPRLEAVTPHVTIDDFLYWNRPGGERLDESVCLTNPPYSAAQQFIERSFELLEPGAVVAMLLRTNFLGSEKRVPFFQRHMPDVYQLPNRPSFIGGRTDSIEYAWMLWTVGQGWRRSGRIELLGSTPLEARRP